MHLIGFLWKFQKNKNIPASSSSGAEKKPKGWCFSAPLYRPFSTRKEDPGFRYIHIPWASTTIKIMVDPISIIKTLNYVINGGYINPPIVLMVGKESQGLYIYKYKYIYIYTCYMCFFQAVVTPPLPAPLALRSSRWSTCCPTCCWCFVPTQLTVGDGRSQTGTLVGNAVVIGKGSNRSGCHITWNWGGCFYTWVVVSNIFDVHPYLGNIHFD